MRHIVLTVPIGEAELAADRLWCAGANAVEERAARAGSVELRSVLAQEEERSIERLGTLPDGWSLTIEDVADVAGDAWRDFVEPIRVNDRLVIRPAWWTGATVPGVTEAVVEPGAAFGLGDHPTTRLAADAVWRLAQPGTTMIDVGCGSGVLGIIAALRGVATVEATDIAEAAHEATHDNARRNGVIDRMSISTTPLAEIDGAYDLVAANILAPVLVALADDLRRVTAPGGHLVLAGILVDRWDHVAEALAPMLVVETASLGEWVGVVLRHP